jgi:SAM-dependent MidA family methyltransferase
VAEALLATGTDEVWEFGAGSGALAEQLITTLDARGQALARYTIVDVSSSLRARQHARLAAAGLAEKVQWASALPEQLRGVVVGNEVLDAMPAKLLARVAGVWYERGVAFEAQNLVFADRPTVLRPPVEPDGAGDYLTEIHPQAEGFVRTLADRLQQGAAFFLDYGFPEHEYYHPQRNMGTLMCHLLHQADTNPLADVGSKDITVHVNFTGVALAGQEAGLQVLGYASQGRFLLNCGLLEGLENTSLAERAMLQKLVNEHEMGELFKVLAFAADSAAHPYSGWQAMGFATGDRSHTL